MTTTIPNPCSIRVPSVAKNPLTEVYRSGPNGTFRKRVQFGNDLVIIIRDQNFKLIRHENRGPLTRKSQLP
jgi:hypothetical protein